MSMMMLWAAVLMLFVQAGNFTLSADSTLNSEEKLKIQKEININGRIKIYKQASERIQRSIQDAIAKNDFETVPNDLKSWTSLLSESLEDIEANLKSKKKSKDLIRFETHVRKAIFNSRNYKTKAPIDQQDLFQSCLDQAEKIRTRFVDILFKRK
jgi:hypothetical protein